MVVRKLAGLALAAGVLVSVAGCSFNPNPESLQSYAPSDGVGTEVHFVDAKGQEILNQVVEFRNMLIVTDGTQYKLFGTVINSGTKTQNVVLSVDTDVNPESQVITVPAGQTVKFDVSNPSTITFSGKAGDLFKMFVGQPHTARGVKLISVPIVDAAIPYYAGLLTSVAPTATPVVTPSATPTM